jgi:ribosome maturation factor RimP
LARINTIIEKLIEEKFQEEEFQDCFLVDINFSGKRLEVFIDSDTSITFKKCQRLSRHLEAYLDESQEITEAYILEVSSPGISRPLKFPRQYIKNIGRKIKIETEEERYKGRLILADEEKIDIEIEKTVKQGKKKTKVKETISIAYINIKKANIQAEF